MLPIVLLAIMIGICVWVAIRVRRVPKRPEHERTPVKRDPLVEISRWPGPGGGGF